MPMTKEQGQAVDRVKRAMTYIATAWPKVGRALVATACASELVELLEHPTIGPDLVAVINGKLAGTPWQITRRQAN